ncbi:hypothetical protein MPSEU_001067200 [Mayamaea pseudoterrestris]|nr:hypothetical protein MPSEU_001067200 [Mayamaea pseudoterrestris]
MLSRTLTFLLSSLLLLLAASSNVSAFVVKQPSGAAKKLISSPSSPTIDSTARFIFNRNKKDDDEDLSFLETRDMTRREMEAYNQRSEQIMNAELWGMTFFSLVLSIPMLYLVYVGFFADTAGIDESLDITY